MCNGCACKLLNLLNTNESFVLRERGSIAVEPEVKAIKSNLTIFRSCDSRVSVLKMRTIEGIYHACSGCQAPTCTSPNSSPSSDSAFTWIQTRILTLSSWHIVWRSSAILSTFDVIKLSWIFASENSSALSMSLYALLLAVIRYRFGKLCFLANSTDSQTISSRTQSINKRDKSTIRNITYSIEAILLYIPIF